MAMRIAVFAAMPQETGPILRTDRGWRPLAAEPFRIKAQRLPGREILLVETGVGGEAAGRAARHVVAMEESEAPVDLMVSAGFAGALSPDLVLGQVVYCNELAVLDSSGVTCVVQYRCCGEPGGETDSPGFFAAHGIVPVCFVTVDRLRPKAEVCAAARGTLAVAEMESTSIAEVAWMHGLPFIGLRAISDEVDLEIDLDLDRLTDQRGRVRRARFAGMVVARPGLARSLPALYRGSRLAGRNLAEALAILLALPEEDLRALGGPPRPVEGS